METTNGDGRVRCASCDAPNDADARFCEGCGAGLARRCPSCGVEANDTARFCKGCGTALTGASAQAHRSPAPGSDRRAVRKMVTVLFADLGDSTMFAERVDPETVRAVMAGLHASQRAVLQDHGAGIVKFAGDGVMALWGVPDTEPDDAHRAVRAGRALHAAFEPIGLEAERHGSPLTLRVAVNTGEVVVGDDDEDIVGDALNVAARLEKECPAGEVVVGDETWRATRDGHEYESLGEITVKGRSEPVGVHRVRGDAAPEQVTAFVGRADELTTIAAALDDVVAGRAVRLVSVIGEPGVGKTTLARQAADGLDGVVVTFGCTPEAGAALGPIVDVLRTIVDDDGDLDLGRLVPDDVVDRAAILDVLDDLVAGGATFTVEETFRALRRLVEVTATDRPLVLVFDDIQWADPVLLDFVEHVVEWTDDAPVLVLALARPEIRDVRATMAEPGHWVDRTITLDGLDADATAELATALLDGGTVPAELAERLPDSTRGNPLFVRELVRMLVQDGVLQSDGDRWRLRLDVDAIDIPPTVQSLLSTRIERLAPDEQRFVEVASVIGTDFDLAAVAALASSTPAAVALVADRLRRLQLVEPAGTYAGDSPVWRFHHVLIRDVAYRRLLKSDRADLHEQLAERGGADEAVARHLEVAHDYRVELGETGAHVEALGRGAATRYRDAARRALERDELTSAAALADHDPALAGGDHRLAADLATIACEATLSLQDARAGVAAVDRLATVLDADDPWLVVYRAQSDALVDPDSLPDAEAALGEAIAAFGEVEDHAGLAKAHLVRARVRGQLGRIADCEHDLDQALVAARKIGDTRRVTSVLGAAPLAALWGPSPVPRAGGRCLDVIRLQRITTAAPSVEAASVRCQAVLEALRGRFENARTMLATARDTVRDLGLRHGQAETDLFVGLVETYAGDPAAAEPHFRAALDGLGSLGVGADAGTAAALLSASLLAQGRVDEADRYAAEAEHRAGRNLKTAIAWRTARAELLSAAGDHDAAVALAREAADIGSGTDVVLDHAGALVTLSRVLRAAGDRAGADRARAEADRLYEAKEAEALVGRSVAAGPIGGVIDSTATDQPGPAALRSSVDLTDSFAWRSIQAWIETYHRGDPDTWTHHFEPDAERIDRRTTLHQGVGDATEVEDSLRRLLEVGIDRQEARPIEIHHDRVVLTDMALVNTETGFHMPMLVVIEVSERGRISWYGMADHDDRATADAFVAERVRRLEGDGIGGTGSFGTWAVPTTTATRAGAAFVERFNAGDVDGALALYHPDIERIDRRSLGGGSARGDEVFASTAGMKDVLPVLTDAVVAVRGDRLMLCKQRTTDAAGSAMENWLVVEVGADGLMVGYVLFDPDDFGSAIAELDRRYVAGEGAAHLDHGLQVAIDVIEALRAGDRDHLRSVLHDDFRCETRDQPFPVLDREQFIEINGQLHENVDHLDHWNRSYEWLSPDLGLLVSARRTVRDGRVDQWDWIGVARFRDGRQWRMDLFAGDRVDEARAFAEELVRAGAPKLPSLDNIATRTVAAFDTLATRTMADAWAKYNAGDIDGVIAHFADDVERDDRRPVVSGGLSRGGEVIDATRAMHSVFGHCTAETLAVRGDLLVAQRLGFGALGAEPSLELLSVWEFDVDGRLTSYVLFDQDAVAETMAELDRRDHGGEGRRRAQAATSPVENAASRRLWRHFDAYNRGDREEVWAFISVDGERDDRRSSIGFGAANPEEIVLLVDGLLDVWPILEPELLDVRGDRFSLWRMTHLNQTRTTAMEALWIVDVVDDRMVAWTIFDVDDLDDAFAELDRLFLEREAGANAGAALLEATAAVDGSAGAPVAERTSKEPVVPPSARLSVENAGSRRLLRHFDAYNRGDREEVKAFVSVDGVRDDRRSSIGFGAANPTEIARLLDGLLDLWPIVEPEVLAVRGTRFSLWRLAHHDRERTTSMEDLWIFDVVGDLMVAWTIFDVDDLDDALAELDRLFLEREAGTTGAPKPSKDVFDPLAVENRASRWVEAQGSLANAGALDEIERRHERDLIRDDRRRLGGGLLTGPEAIAGVVALADLGDASIEVLAVRGERLVLVRAKFSSEEAFTIEILVVIELSERDLAARFITFDPDDLHLAEKALNERYYATEGAAFADVALPTLDNTLSVGAMERETFRATLTDDFRLEMPGGLTPPMDRDGMVDYLFGLAEEAAELRMWFPTVRWLSTRTFVNRTRRIVTDADGVERRWDWIAVGEMDAGRIRRLTMFHADEATAAMDLALRRDAESAPQRVETPALLRVDNAAMRLLLTMDGTERDDADSRMTPDYERLDRRSGVAASTADGPGQLAALDELRSLFSNERHEPIAARGDRHAAVRTTFDSDEGFELAMLRVAEFDEEMRIRRQVVFDADDLEGAMVELDERYYADEGADVADDGLALTGFMSALRRHDWDELRQRLAPGFRFVPRDGTMWTSLTIDEYIDYCDEGFAQAASSRAWFPTVEFRPGGIGLGWFRHVATYPDGSEGEWSFFQVGLWQAGRLLEQHMRAADRAAEALTYVDELAARVADPLALDNLARRCNEQFVAAWNAGKDLEPLLADDFVRLDRRSTVFDGATPGPSDYATTLSVTRDVTPTMTVEEWVAIRGETLCLTRSSFASDSFDFEVLVLTEFDADGLAVAVELFDPDDLGAAVVALERRYYAGEGVERAKNGELWIAAMEALAARDPEGWRLLAAPDTAVRFHGPILDPDMTGDQQTTTMFGQMLEAEEWTQVYPVFRWITGEVGFARVHTTARLDGLDAEWDMVIIGQWRNGVVVSIDLWPIEQSAEAFAFMEELFEGDSPNFVVRH